MIPEFDKLQSILPPSGWFIAGGSLLPGYYSDVDIYFTSEDSYELVLATIKTIHHDEPTTTAFATTFSYFFQDRIHLQLIHRNFGDHVTILSDFDLNKSRQALLPDGTLYQHPTFHQDLYFEPENLRYNTLDRVEKYISDKEQRLDVPRFLTAIEHTLQKPLDTEYGHYYLDKKEAGSIHRNIGQLLKKFLLNYFWLFGHLMPLIDALEPYKALQVYQAIISGYTDLVPLPSMSIEFQTALYPAYQARVTWEQKQRTSENMFAYREQPYPDLPFNPAIFTTYPELFL